MSDQEYKDKCTMCWKKGQGIAHSFYRQIDNQWHWLCKDCWKDYDFYGKKIEEENNA